LSSAGVAAPCSCCKRWSLCYELDQTGPVVTEQVLHKQLRRGLFKHHTHTITSNMSRLPVRLFVPIRFPRRNLSTTICPFIVPALFQYKFSLISFSNDTFNVLAPSTTNWNYVNGSLVVTSLVIGGIALYIYYRNHGQRPKRTSDTQEKQ